MKFLPLFVLILAVLDSTSCFAYTTKKREQRRPAFKASSSVTSKDEGGASPSPTTVGVPATAAFAFAPAVAHTAYASAHEDALDDEELIGYGTALITCFLSLALGFGLGYGT